MTRFVVFSDTHLGAGTEHATDRLADQAAVLDEIAALAAGSSGVLFAGDMYHRPHPSERAREIFARFLGQLRAAEVPLTAITGNALHDIINAAEPAPMQTAAVHDPMLHLSRVPELIELPGDVSLVTLPSVPMHRRVAALDGGDRREIFEEAVDLLLEAARGLYDKALGSTRILMGHWACDWPDLPPQMRDHEPVLPLDALEEIGFDVILMGHIHMPLHVGRSVSVGPPAHVSFGEEGLEHGCWILDVTGPGDVTAEFVPLSDRRFVTVDVDLTEPQKLVNGFGIPVTLDETDLLAAELGSREKLEDAVVRIRYHASEEQDRRVDRAALIRLAYDAGAHKVMPIDADVIRTARARVDGFDRGLGEHDALTAYCAKNEITAETADRLHATLTASRERAAALDTVTPASAFDPVSIDARNVGRFRDLHIPFEDGVMVLLGPNGSGKSTALRCVELGLYARDGGDLRDFLLTPTADEMELTFTFTLDRILHRIRRTYRRTASGGTATLDLEVNRDGNEWESITQESAAATQKLIVRLLGMSHEVFRASCFLAQGDAPAFLRAAPKDRKAMFGEILDPAGLWAADTKYAAAESKRVADLLVADKTLAATLEPAAAQVAQLKQDIAAEDLASVTATTGVEKSEKELEGALAAVQSNQAAAAAYTAARAARDTATQEHARAIREHDAAKTEADRLPAAREALTQLDERAARIPELELLDQEQHAAELLAESKRRELAEANAALDRQKTVVDGAELLVTAARAAAESTQTRLTHLEQAEDGSERCDRCEQILGEQARAAAIESLTLEVAAKIADFEHHTLARDKAAASLPALEQGTAIEIPHVPTDDHSKPLADARGAAERREGVAVQITQFEKHAAELDFLQEAVRAAAATLDDRGLAVTIAAGRMSDHAELEEGVRFARAELSMHRGALDAVKASIVRLEEQHARATAAAAELTEIRARTAPLQTELDVLRVAERAFGRDGIPVLLVETVLDDLGRDANEILRRLPKKNGSTFQIRFETQREQVSTDRLKEELYVIVVAPDWEQDFRVLSGGEESRVSYAVRIALGMLLGRLRGAESRVLFIDELPYLDEVGEEHIVDTTRHLTVSGLFSKVVTVSHSPNVRDAFDSVIEIQEVDGVSSVVGDRELVAVAS